MSDTTKTKAERLAACCRVLWPDREVTVHEPSAVCIGFSDPLPIWLRPTFLDTIAYLVAAMSLEQRNAFDGRLAMLLNGNYGSALDAAQVFSASPETHLAAVEAALGA